MANNDDFDEIDDLDAGGESLPAGSAKSDVKADLKKLWDGNPLLKIAAVIVAAGVVFAAYGMIMGGDDKSHEEQSVVASTEAGASAAPGTEKLDPAYEKALREKNQQQVEVAEQTGVSAIPTPIGTTGGQIEIPDVSKKGDTDPLAEWRAAAAMSQFSSGQKMEEIEDAAPDVVPMAQPLKPQVQAQLPPEVVQKLTEQMGLIVAAQEPKEGKAVNVTILKNEYTRAMEKKAAEEQKLKDAGGIPGPELAGVRADQSGAVIPASTGSGPSGTASTEKIEVVVSAGNVSYGQLLNELNSDIEGPVLVSILSGPLAGARAIGKFKMQDEYLTLSFERVVKGDDSYKVNAVAMDEHTTLTGMQSDVDHHYVRRVILPAAAEFVSGMGGAIAKTSTTTTVGTGGSTTTDEQKPDAKEQLYKGVEKAADKVSDLLDKDASPPITVKLKKGTTMGILFLEPVKNTDIEK